MFTKSLIAAAAALSLSAVAHAAVTFDGNIELDPTYTAGATNKTELGGRVELNATGELARSGDNFISARASLILPVNGDDMRTDDLWLQAGNSVGDIKLGRFEAANLFVAGMDTVVAKTSDAAGYNGNSLRGRVKNRLHALLGVNAAPGLRLELGVVGKETGGTGTYGLRPVATYTAGPLSVRVGAEALRTDNSNAKSTGTALSVSYAVNAATTVNASFANNSKLDKSGIALNAVIGMAGIGYMQDKSATNKVNTVYVAYKMPLMGIKNAFITPALSHSNSSAAGVANVNAVRVRLNYAF